MVGTREAVIAGNWKMNGLQREARALAAAVAAGAASVTCALIVCPPATLLSTVGESLRGSPVALGGQDCHPSAQGAHTGDISAGMLADIGCAAVIVGHSERRSDHGEDDALVCAKAAAAHAAGLTAIVCVGESEAQRDAGATLLVVGGQVTNSLPVSASADNTIVAYEPVWAIGTGRTPTLDEIQEVHGHIRQTAGAKLGGGEGAALRLLYGGSVKPENAAEILAIGDVDGGLIGGASLTAEDFLAIAKSCP